MVRGRAKNQRRGYVDQAGLVWAERSTAELQTYVETGRFSGRETKVEPYVPEHKAIVSKLLGLEE